MKKLITAFFLLALFSAQAQNNKWFFSVSTSAVIGGPSAALKKQMTDKGYDDTESVYFLGLGLNTTYPRKASDGNFMLRGGKRINDRRSLYFSAGLADKGKVEGFREMGFSGLPVIMGGSTGLHASISYSVWQLTAGYMYSKNYRIKWGLGPSLFLFNYKPNEGDRQTAFVPGASFTSRIPLGKEKRLFGIDLLLDASLAPPVKVDMKDTSPGAFKATKANMIHGSIGFACSFRRQAGK